MRKLLPYETVLIEALDITEEEYFEFRKAQSEYGDIKTGTIFDVRNEAGTIALILTIVGTLAQVGAALLAPKPEVPAADNQRRSRDQRFAPRYGFDSFQDLSQFGDPLNLVYTNQGSEDEQETNPNGGVRVNTSLLWSAVYSNGNSQYVQLLAAIGASDITNIDPSLTAFGQTLVKLFAQASSWQYFGQNGPLQYSQLLQGTTTDPYRDSNLSLIYRPTINEEDQLTGYSQAFSPSSSSEFGIYSPIPIAVSVFARDGDGDEKRAPLKIDLSDEVEAIWRNKYLNAGARKEFPRGFTFTMKIAKVSAKTANNEAVDAAEEIRFAAAESIEKGTLYKLGTALFQVQSIGGESTNKNEGLDRETLKITFVCIEPGYAPWEDYATEDIDEERDELKQQRTNLKAQLDTLTLQKTEGLRVTDYIIGDISEKKKRIIEQLANQVDVVEELLELVVSYRRNKSQMDELVNTAEANGDVDQVVQRFAGLVNASEEALEKLKSRRNKLLATIERRENNNQNTRQEEATLATIEKNIIEAKKELRSTRSRLANAVREYGVADGVVATQVAAARKIANDVQNIFEGLAVDKSGIPNFAQMNARAGQERRVLRKLRNYLRRLQDRVLAILPIDQAAMELAYSQLDTQISTVQKQLTAVIDHLSDPDSFNDFLGTKCMAKVTNATYQSITASNVIHFAVKAKVFMRVQGRATTYGQVDVKDEGKQYKDKDNGQKFRTALFTVSYREVGTELWSTPGAIFCVRRSFDRETFLPLTFADLTARKRWEFKFEPVLDPSAQALKMGFDATGTNVRGEKLKFIYLEGKGETKQIDSFYYKGYARNGDEPNLPPRNKSPFGIDEWTLFSTHSDTSLQFSFDNGPEFKIAAISEQQIEALPASLYSAMSLIGFNAYSGAGLTSLRNLSVFVTKGKKVRTIQLSPPSYSAEPNASSCLAPEIFLDTILDPINGIGQYTDVSGVDIEKLADAKKFCLKNGYYMDGVIAEKGAWRSFWSEVAPFGLLELSRIGGKEALIPSVPTLGDGSITDSITISALFNQGNILADTYKEEFLDYGENTEDLIATIIYRSQPDGEAFPRNTSVTIKRKDTIEATASRRTFDLSNFVTNRQQALDYGILLVEQRHHIKRSIEFKTFPSQAPIAPGSYIYVQIDDNEWDNLHSGSVMDDGSVNIPFADESLTGTFDTLIYKPASTPIKASVTFTAGQTSDLSQYAGTGALFVVGTERASKRVFRVVEVGLEPEGEVKIGAVEHPCKELAGQTKSQLINLDGNGRFNYALYDIEN